MGGGAVSWREKNQAGCSKRGLGLRRHFELWTLRWCRSHDCPQSRRRSCFKVYGCFCKRCRCLTWGDILYQHAWYFHTVGRHCQKWSHQTSFQRPCILPCHFLHQQSMGHLLGATGDIEEDYHPGLLLEKTAIYFKPGLYRITIWSQLCSIQGMHNPHCLHPAPECYTWYNWSTYTAHRYHAKSLVYIRFHSMCALCELGQMYNELSSPW